LEKRLAKNGVECGKMLGFILSKMNLLIMVTAIFAIVAYFMIFVNQGTVGRQANGILTNMVEETQGVVSSSGQCHQSIVRIPRYIQTVGTTSLGGRVRFTIRVNKICVPEPCAPGGEKIVSYSLWTGKGNDAEAIAAKPFSTSADGVYLFPWDVDTGGSPMGNPGPEMPLDPNGKIPVDSLMLVKEVFLGKTFLYIFPCSSELDWCRVNYISIKGKISPPTSLLPERGIGDFSCADPFPSSTP